MMPIRTDGNIAATIAMRSQNGIAAKFLSSCYSHVNQTAIKLTPQRCFGFLCRTAHCNCETTSEAVMGTALEALKSTPLTFCKHGYILLSGFGLGCLCTYGATMKERIGATDAEVFWTKDVKRHIRSTYSYMIGTLGISAASAIIALDVATFTSFVERDTIVALILAIFAEVSTGALCRYLQYHEHGAYLKKIAWLFHSISIGVSLVPMAAVIGPSVLRVAWCLGGMTLGIALVGRCAQNEAYLQSVFLPGVWLGYAMSSATGRWLAHTSKIQSTRSSVLWYGGLLLFCSYLAYGVHTVIRMAQEHSIGATGEFDPINACMNIYFCPSSICIKMAEYLSHRMHAVPKNRD